MNRIDSAFKLSRRDGRKALVVFLTAGDPSLSSTEDLVVAASEAGADIIELGVPFSDPMADGPTIQAASQRALAAKTSLPGILETVTRIRQRTEIPLVLFSYYNILFRYGIEQLAADAAEAGVDGVLIVDVPYEEMTEIKPTFDAQGLPMIRLLAPTTPDERMTRLVKEAGGFIYCITVTGVTGARHDLPDDLSTQLEKVRHASPVPVVAGFGISTPDMARNVAQHADGIVVGSALVKLLAEQASHEERVQECKRFVGGIAEALKPDNT